MRRGTLKNVLFNEETLLIRRGGILTSIRSGDHGEIGTLNVHKIYKLHNLGHNFY